MMFSKKTAFLLAFCLCVGGFYFYKSTSINQKAAHDHENASEHDSHDHDSNDHSTNSRMSSQPNKGSTANPKIKLDPKLAAHDAHNGDPHKMGKTVELPALKDREPFEPVDEKERSLETMATEVIQLVQESRSHKDFLEFLNKNELKPRISDPKDADSSGMIMIRSDKALAGTRYYHAQFFRGEKGEKPFAQHVSFEYPPGKDSFERAQKAVEVLAATGKKTYSIDSSLVEYKLENCYTLWIKKQSLEDLKNDPFNAYSNEDDGSIKVALEQDIHCTDD